MQIIITSTRFPLGQIVITPNALSTLTPTDIDRGLRRHSQGDWGNVYPDDAALNNQALIACQFDRSSELP